MHNDDAGRMQQQSTGSVFDSLNQRLHDAGVPTWNLGPFPVEPIVSAGFVVVFLLMGLRGIIFGLLLFLIVKWSSSESAQGGGTFQNIIAQGQNFFTGGDARSNQPQRREGTGRQPDTGNPRSWPQAGQGQKLGR